MAIRAVGNGEFSGQAFVKGIVTIAAVVLVIYVIKKAAERNQVEEECRDGVLTGRCARAVAHTAQDVAADVGAVAGACFPAAAPMTCLGVGAGVLARYV